MASVDSMVACSGVPECSKFPALWASLDAIHCGESDDAPGPLQCAINAVTQVQGCLLRSGVTQSGQLADVLQGALADLRTVEVQAECLVHQMAEVEGWPSLSD